MSDPLKSAATTCVGSSAEHPDLVESGWKMPVGRRTFIAGVAGAAAATAISSSVHAAVPAGASYYEPVAPVRVADTRTYGEFANVAKDFQQISNGGIRIDIRGRSDVPNNGVATGDGAIVAVVISLATIFNGKQGWTHAVPAGSTSHVANVNVEPGDGAVSNMATVRLGADGKIDVKGSSVYDVVVDILGVYRLTTQPKRAGRTIFLSKTRRALDNVRVSKRRQSVPISFVPQSAQAVIVNLAAAGTRSYGFLAAVATGTAKLPNVANLTYSPGEDRSAGSIVKLGRDASGTPSIDVYSEGDVQVYVDVAGYITGESDTQSDSGLFVPINPYRAIDTRLPTEVARTNKSRLWPRWSRAFELPENTLGFGARSQMSGVAMNVALVSGMAFGFVTALGAQTTRQFVSNLNVTRIGHTVSNHVISQASTRGIELYAACGGDVVADIAGWYTGVPQAITQANVTEDPPPPSAPFNWFLNVPRMGLQNFVVPNIYSGDPVVDAGNTWHWTNTGMIGDAGASIVVFGHRTSANRPYYYQHNLLAGDELFVVTPDQRLYTYRFIGEQLTGDAAGTILNAARLNSAGTTFTLVACTGTRSSLNDQPLGGVRYRIVSTFALVGWTDIAPRGSY